MNGGASIEVRSYRRVFDLERRIYSVDRLRLNPGGVPVRAVMYFLALLCVGLVVATLPPTDAIDGSLPWFVREIALPAAAATVLSMIRIEGRSFHLAAFALARHICEGRRLTGCRRAAPIGARWRPPAILLLPDGSDGRLRRMRYTGPGAVLVCVEHERHGRAHERGRSAAARPGLGAELIISQRDRAGGLERGQVIVLSSGSSMLVRPGRR